MLTIYDTTGAMRFETPINKGSKRVFKLMGDDYVTLKFSVKTPIYFELGDYCNIPDFGLFELAEPYQPSYNSSTGGYDYELKLEAQHMKWRNKIMRYLPNYGGNETSWQLTATAEVHLEQVLLNVDALANPVTTDGDEVINQGYLYNREESWQIYIDGTVDASAKTLSYDSTNIIDALTAIAEAFECEWWLNGNIICLGKCELTNEYIDLELGVNVADMSRSDSKEDYVTRILAFGSERNISPRYRKDLIFDVKEIANGGNRISDTSRKLSGDWFPSSLVVVPSSDKQSYTFTKTKSGTVQATNAGDVLFLSDSETYSGIRAGDWTVQLSAFKPTMTFELRQGTINNYRVRISVCGTPSAGGDTITASWESQPYIYSLSAPISPSFADQTISIPSDLSSLTIMVNFLVCFSGSGSIEASLSPSTSHTIVLANSDPIIKISGLIIEKIDESGNTTDTFTGATFNPDFKETVSERNWIQLPDGAVMGVGDRYRITNIIASKVKSSYFSSRYSAYADTANVVTNGIVTSRLMLPESYGTAYVDYEPGLSMEQGVEDVVIFEDIYPRAVCAITSINTVQRKKTVENDDGSTTDTTYTAYQIKDDFFTSAHPFSNDYILANETLQITFQDGKRYEEGDTIPDGKKVGDLINPDSGKLNGWTFEVQFTKDTDGSAIWEIVRDNTSYIPNDILKPEIGDQFVLHGFDISAVDDLYVEEAEKELLEAAQKYLEELNTDPSTYECTIMPDVAKEGVKFELGTRINLINEAYIESTVDDDGRKWGRKSRVIGYEICLDIPYDNPIYTIGEKAKYSRFGEIEDQLDALKYSMAQTALGSASSSSSNTSGIYVIGQTDVTPASDSNVFSALRSKLEFLSKKASETINYLWTFAQGLYVGNYVANNDGAKVDPNGDAEFNDVVIRKGINASGDVNVDGGITVQKGITIGSYQPGSYGGRVWIDDDGKVHIETDYLEAREKTQTKEVEIQEETHVGGCQIISPAAMRCSRVIPVYNELNSVTAYKCCFTAEDEDGNQIYNQFDTGDLAKCETFNLVKQSNGMVGNHYYWRKVIETGYIESGDADYDDEYGREGYIVLSNKTAEKDSASDAPLAGDRIITVGNDDPTKTDRSNLIILASYGTGSPYIYQYKGINTFSLNSDNLKTAISPNGNLFTGKFVIENGSTETDVVDYIENNIYLEAYQLVLSNEMACVPYDDDDKPIGNLPSSAITVYKGKTVETGWTFSIDCIGCVAAIAYGTLYVSALNEKNATVTVTATKTDCPTLTKVMTIVKVKDGEMGTQGEHAVQFEIEPDALIVLADMDEVCDPEKLGCKVYMVIGNQTRVEVPLANTSEITTYAAGDKLLFFNGKLFVDRPVEVDVPTDLILRYVVTYQDYITDEETNKVTPVVTSEIEHIYTGQAITMTARIKNIIFKLYRGTTLVDVQTVVVTTDATAMKVTYNTRFEIDEKRIEMEASRTTQNEEDIASLKITAEEIQSSVSKTTGLIQSSNGRNLLLGTNQNNLNWGYTSDSATKIVLIRLVDYPHWYCPRIATRSDSTYEVFYYKLRPQMIVAGEKYTLSFKIQSVGTASEAINFYAQISNTDSSGALTDTAYFPVTVTSGTQSMEVTLTASATGNENESQVVMIGVIPADVNKWTALNIWNLKLEAGEVATAYCAAPEDYADYRYEELSTTITQTAEEIRSEVNAMGDEIGALSTQISQTANSLSVIAINFNSDGTPKSGAGWLMTSDCNNLYVFDANGGLVSFINQTASSIKIKASHISLEGVVTANNNFKILDDGSIEATNAKIYGTIYASAGNIGGFTISNGALEWSSYESYGSTFIDFNSIRIGKINSDYWAQSNAYALVDVRLNGYTFEGMTCIYASTNSSPQKPAQVSQFAGFFDGTVFVSDTLTCNICGALTYRALASRSSDGSQYEYWDGVSFDFNDYDLDKVRFQVRSGLIVAVTGE